MDGKVRAVDFGEGELAMPDFGPLFSPRPLSRSTDGETSRAAASGAAKRAVADRVKLLAAVRAKPGRTSAEYAVDCGIDRHAAGRRLPEMLDAGQVVKGEARRCEARGTMACTWWPVNQGRLEIA